MYNAIMVVHLVKRIDCVWQDLVKVVVGMSVLIVTIGMEKNVYRGKCFKIVFGGE
jgi:hypothetical protein